MFFFEFFLLKIHRGARQCITVYKVSLDKIHIKRWREDRCGGFGKNVRSGKIEKILCSVAPSTA